LPSYQYNEISLIGDAICCVNRRAAEHVPSFASSCLCDSQLNQAFVTSVARLDNCPFSARWNSQLPLLEQNRRSQLKRNKLVSPSFSNDSMESMLVVQALFLDIHQQAEF
jgi:hypothetical protein